MKGIAVVLIFISVVAAIGASFYFFKGRSVGCLTDFGIVGINKYGNGHQSKVNLTETQLSDLEKEIKVWWSVTNKGWRPSFVSYVPQLLISVKSGSLNVLTNKIVVTCNGVQLERKLEDADSAFFEKVKSAH